MAPSIDLVKSRVAAAAPLATAIIAIVLAGLYLAVRSMMPRPLPGIPYNKKAVGNLFGDMPALLSHKRRTGSGRMWLVKQLEDHNSVLVQVFLKPWSSRPAILMGDYREYYDMSLRRTKEFDRSQVITDDFSPALPENQLVLGSHSPGFKQSKQLVKDLMTPAFLNEISGPVVYRRAEQIIRLWDEKRRLSQGRPFAVREDLLGGALDMIMGVAFPPGEAGTATQKTLDLLRDVSDGSAVLPPCPGDEDTPFVFPDVPLPEESQAVMNITHGIGLVQNSPSPSLHYFILKQFPQLRRAIAVKEGMIRNHITRAAVRLSEPDAELTCAMDRMIQREIKAAEKETRPPNFHSRKLYDELFGYLVGGSDTTATTFTWFCKFIADNPSAQSTLRAALRAAHGTAASERRAPNLEEITSTSVPYLDATMEELLRCAGTVPFVPRDAIVDTTLLGHRIPKGTLVLFINQGPGIVSPPVGQQVPEELRSESSRAHADVRGAWDAAGISSFMPERWLVPAPEGAKGVGKESFNPAAGPHMAFGAGPRGCFGRRLAYLELRILFTMLIWNFEFLPLPEALRSYEGLDGVTTLPKMAYVKLRRVG